ncbi:MAG TPA: hypothetical protein DEA05_09885 [Rhodobacteraceae bacterium]|jgi:LPS-assembly lipoprotein|nr:hypothetical protein [Paracoccaceae bacterium]
MSSFDRRTLLALPLALAACGFQPVYGPGGTGTALHGRVAVNAPTDRNSFLLVQELEVQLGQPTDPLYRLVPRLTLAREEQAITRSNEITRYSIVGQVDYEMIRLADQAVVASGSVENFTGYSATGSTVETLAAERDAHARLMTMLADATVARLQATAVLAE